MKIINAYWEKRNLGLETAEIIFNADDTIEELHTSKILIDYDLIVAKVYRSNIALMHDLESLGFRFMETQILLSFMMQQFEKLQKTFENIIDKATFHKVQSESELQNVITQIQQGMFDTDRIALDPCLGKDKSSLRYVNWVKDCFCSERYSLYEILIENNRIGFSLLDLSDPMRAHGLLGGIYNQYKNYGYFTSILYETLRICHEKKHHFFNTSISTNNIEVFRIYNAFNFGISDISYVLRKINITNNRRTYER